MKIILLLFLATVYLSHDIKGHESSQTSATPQRVSSVMIQPPPVVVILPPVLSQRHTERLQNQEEYSRSSSSMYLQRTDRHLDSTHKPVWTKGHELSPQTSSTPQRIHRVQLHRSSPEYILPTQQQRHTERLQNQKHYGQASSSRYLQKTDRHTDSRHEAVEELWPTKGGSVKSEMFDTRLNVNGGHRTAEGVKS